MKQNNKKSRFINIVRKIGIKNRLIATFLLVSIVPIIVLGMYSYATYTKSINNKLHDSNYQALNLVNNIMLNELEKLNYMTSLISMHEHVQKFLQEFPHNDIMNKRQFMLDVNDIIGQRSNRLRSVQNIVIVNLEGIMAYEMGYKYIPRDKLQSRVEKLNRYPQERLSHGIFSSFAVKDNEGLLLLSKQIYDIDSIAKKLGHIMIFFNESFLADDILSSIHLAKDSEILVLNEDGKVVSSSNHDTLRDETYFDSSTFDRIKENTVDNYFNDTVSGKSYQISYIYNEDIRWYTVLLVPTSYITSETRTISFRVIVLAIVLTIVCIVLMYILLISIIQPMINIKNKCKNISKGIFDRSIDDNLNDEMSMLSSTVDDMSNKIDDMIKTQREQQDRERELELEMLQYQINPHFLFNTLNSLKWIAQINNVTTLSEGIGSLSKLLQGTLINKDKLVTLSEEIENLNSYIYTQKIRYADSFEVKYSIDDNQMEILLPKLILQPIVENSIIHGNQNNSKVTIEITAVRQDDMVNIVIKDNGKGFDAANKANSKTKPKLSGIGINNVNERIKLIFGNEYGLTIASTVGVGTIVTLTFPITTDKDK